MWRRRYILARTYSTRFVGLVARVSVLLTAWAGRRLLFRNVCLRGLDVTAALEGGQHGGWLQGRV